MYKIAGSEVRSGYHYSAEIADKDLREQLEAQGYDALVRHGYFYGFYESEIKEPRPAWGNSSGKIIGVKLKGEVAARGLPVKKQS